MSIHERLAEVTGFQWDAGNVEKNWIRHAVSVAGCEQLFFNEPLVVASDEKHARAETRFHALGQTNDGRRLLVVFTLRDTLIRVISAREMSRRERAVCESQ